MDPLDNYLDQYLNNLVNQCLQTLPAENQTGMAEKIRDYLYQAILSVVIDNLSEEQLTQLEGLDPQSPQMEEKIKEFTGQMPGLAVSIDEQLKKAVTDFQQNPNIINNS